MQRADSLKRPWCWERLKREENGTTEDEMVEWHHWLNGHELEQAPGVGDIQGSLAYCSPWGRQELDMTERLNWTEHNAYSVFHSHVIFYYCLHYLHKSPTVSSFKFWPWLGIIHRHGLFGYKSHISNRLKELIHWGIVGLHHRSV